MSLFAVLNDIEMEVIAWMDGLEWRYAATYAQQDLIGGKGVLQHTGFAPDEASVQAMLHASWCNPATEFARLRDKMLAAEPLAFVLGTGEYRGVFVITDIAATTRQTDGAGALIGIELQISLKEYIGDPATPNPPGVIGEGYRIPLDGLASGAEPFGGPLGELLGMVTDGVAAAGQALDFAARAQSVVALASRDPLAALAAGARLARDGLGAANALPVEAFATLTGVASVAASAGQVVTGFTRARDGLLAASSALSSGNFAAVSASAKAASSAVTAVRGDLSSLASWAVTTARRNPELISL